MDSHADGVPVTPAGLDHVSTTLGTDLAGIWTVLAVETGGFGFLPDRRPKVLFERHIFHHVTKGRFDAAHPDIGSATPAGYIGAAGEYDRIPATVKLDYESALDSASWGIGQILGFNSDRVGYELRRRHGGQAALDQILENHRPPANVHSDLRPTRSDAEAARRDSPIA